MTALAISVVVMLLTSSSEAADLSEIVESRDVKGLQLLLESQSPVQRSGTLVELGDSAVWAAPAVAGLLRFESNYRSAAFFLFELPGRAGKDEALRMLNGGAVAAPRDLALKLAPHGYSREKAVTTLLDGPEGDCAKRVSGKWGFFWAQDYSAPSATENEPRALVAYVCEGRRKVLPLRSGDVVVSIDGYDVDFDSARVRFAEANELQVVLQRRDETLTVRLERPEITRKGR